MNGHCLGTGWALRYEGPEGAEGPKGRHRRARATQHAAGRGLDGSLGGDFCTLLISRVHISNSIHIYIYIYMYIQ